MKFDSIRIILVTLSHPGNIGSTTRAMKAMGLHRLYLVSPKVFPALAHMKCLQVHMMFYWKRWLLWIHWLMH